MAKIMLQEKICLKLVSDGWIIVSSRTSKYRTLENTNKKYKLFVGRHGALRKGQTVSKSVSWTDNSFYKSLIE